MNIVGILITTLPDVYPQVKPKIIAAGAEVHAISATGQIVATLEHENNSIIIDALTILQAIEGILNVAIVYQHSETNTG